LPTSGILFTNQRAIRDEQVRVDLELANAASEAASVQVAANIAPA
jgi:hypothetical protein